MTKNKQINIKYSVKQQNTTSQPVVSDMPLPQYLVNVLNRT